MNDSRIAWLGIGAVVVGLGALGCGRQPAPVESKESTTQTRSGNVAQKVARTSDDLSPNECAKSVNRDERRCAWYYDFDPNKVVATSGETNP